MTTDFEALQIQWRDYFQKMAEQIVDIVRKNPGLLAAGPPVELAEDSLKAEARCRFCGGLNHGGSCKVCKNTVWAQRRNVPTYQAPARVTDVRFNNGGVSFRVGAERYFYDGNWLGTAHRFHPSDIALIERCWAEGRLGEREVLFDSGVVGTIEDASPDYNPVDGSAFRFRFADGGILWLGEPNRDNATAWMWRRHGGPETIHDPTQRARVRAIVAGMQKERRPGEPPPGADSTQYDNAPPVTPSGEVKAPFGLEWARMSREGCRCLSIGGLQLSVMPDGGWTADDTEGPDGAWEGRRDDPETFLRILHAALSDHIRRGDAKIDWTDPAKLRNIGYALCPNCKASYDPRQGHSCRQPFSPAPDLTELREAWKAYGWTGPECQLNQVLGAVEKLVSRPESYPKSWQAGYDAALAGLGELRENLGTASDAQIAHIARKVLRHGN